MDDRSAIFYAFLLIALLIGVVYYQGLQTDSNAFASGATKIIGTLQGRINGGGFANYPTTQKA